MKRESLRSRDFAQAEALRSVFAAPEGRRLLVADYAQLELRLVAHLSHCQAMQDVFQSGGERKKRRRSVIRNRVT